MQRGNQDPMLGLSAAQWLRMGRGGMQDGPGPPAALMQPRTYSTMLPAEGGQPYSSADVPCGLSTECGVLPSAGMTHLRPGAGVADGKAAALPNASMLPMHRFPASTGGPSAPVLAHENAYYAREEADMVGMHGMDFSFLGDYSESSTPYPVQQQPSLMPGWPRVAGPATHWESSGYAMAAGPSYPPFSAPMQADSMCPADGKPMKVALRTGATQFTSMSGMTAPHPLPHRVDASERVDGVAEMLQQSKEGRAQKEYPECRWHESAAVVGTISDDGHVFTKEAGPRQRRVSEKGRPYELATICMVFDSSLRSGGVHRYQFHIMNGDLGPADGAGFTFDTKVRRRSIQQMCAVFLNQRGCICLRRRQHVTKLPARLPALTVGTLVTMIVDLDNAKTHFQSSRDGVSTGSAHVNVRGLFDGVNESGNETLRSGFFCAVVTGNISVGLF